jgi:hypothetical protein
MTKDTLLDPPKDKPLILHTKTLDTYKNIKKYLMLVIIQAWELGCLSRDKEWLTVQRYFLVVAWIVLSI